eukprot:jgi/Galph1/3795/GphlegSOOS_G2508.1
MAQVEDTVESLKAGKSNIPEKESASQEMKELSGNDISSQEQQERRRRRRSRWESIDVKENEMRELKTKLDALTRLINSGNIPVDELCRSPSPEPIYDAKGRRVNTRADRARDKLEEERLRICERLKILDPYFQPPPGIRPLRVSEKMYLPVNDYPNVNFIGLILGPRGNTHKRLEKDFNCRIAIRGKGSVKDGRNRVPAPDDNDDLHVVVTSEGTDAKERVRKCLEKIQELITVMDDEQNEHKQAQLRELAALNGTLRDRDNFRKDELLRGASGMFSNSINCKICGDSSHPTVDCPRKYKNPDNADLDAEYQSFLEELGGTSSHDMKTNENSSVVTCLENKPQRIPPWRIHYGYRDANGNITYPQFSFGENGQVIPSTEPTVVSTSLQNYSAAQGSHGTSLGSTVRRGTNSPPPPPPPEDDLVSPPPPPPPPPS